MPRDGLPFSPWRCVGEWQPLVAHCGLHPFVALEFTAASGGTEYDAGALIDRMPSWGEDLRAQVSVPAARGTLAGQGRRGSGHWRARNTRCSELQNLSRHGPDIALKCRYRGTFTTTFYFTTGMIMSQSHGISRAVLTLLCTAGAWWQRTQVARH